MKVSIRASKYQKADMTTGQFAFASKCVSDYMIKGHKAQFDYTVRFTVNMSVARFTRPRHKYLLWFILESQHHDRTLKLAH